MPRVPNTAATEAPVTKALYDEHAAVLWRHAMRLTGDANRAEAVVEETLLRAWLFTVARDTIVGARRTTRFRTLIGSLDTSSTPEQSVPDEVNAPLDRPLIADAITQVSAEDRAVSERFHRRGRTTAQIAVDLQILEGTVKSR